MMPVILLFVGGELVQEDEEGIDFYSKKWNKHQNRYSTVEKETLGFILALQHFAVY